MSAKWLLFFLPVMISAPIQVEKAGLEQMAPFFTVVLHHFCGFRLWKQICQENMVLLSIIATLNAAA